MHKSIGEFGLIERVRELFAPLVPDGVMGIGDDCAVIANGQNSTVITLDMLCDGVHFTLDMGGYAIGRRAVMVNLSDVAAMGAEPTAIFVAISVPNSVDDQFLTDFFAGIRSCNIALLGGDTTRSASNFVVTITAMGSAPSANIKLRSGAQNGDVVFVAGQLGAQAASGFRANVTAQTAQGVWLGARNEVSSMMDISDGLAGDLPHILRASNVGATVELSSIPIAPNATIEQALSGGEDFVLLMTATAQLSDNLCADFLATFGTPLYNIGTICGCEPAVTYTQNGIPVTIKAQGYTHF